MPCKFPVVLDLWILTNFHQSASLSTKGIRVASSLSKPRFPQITIREKFPVAYFQVKIRYNDGITWGFFFLVPHTDIPYVEIREHAESPLCLATEVCL